MWQILCGTISVFISCKHTANTLTKHLTMTKMPKLDQDLCLLLLFSILFVKQMNRKRKARERENIHKHTYLLLEHSSSFLFCFSLCKPFDEIKWRPLFSIFRKYFVRFVNDVQMLPVYVWMWFVNCVCMTDFLCYCSSNWLFNDAIHILFTFCFHLAFLLLLLSICCPCITIIIIIDIKRISRICQISRKISVLSYIFTFITLCQKWHL